MDETTPVLASPESTEIRGSFQGDNNQGYNHEPESEKKDQEKDETKEKRQNKIQRNDISPNDVSPKDKRPSSDSDSLSSIKRSTLDQNRTSEELETNFDQDKISNVEKRESFSSIEFIDDEVKIIRSQETLKEIQKADEEKPVSPNTRCANLKKTLKSSFKPLTVSGHDQLPQNPSLAQKLHHGLLLPPHGPFGQLLTQVLIILTLWLTCMAMFGKIAVPPDGTHFLLIVLVICAILVGKLFTLARLPALLGMLITGIVLKNLPGIHFDDHWSSYSSTLRGVALVVILLRAGLGLDPVALKRLSGMVFRLAFIPCLTEAVTVAVASHFLLGLPWLWGFMLGFVLAAVSPAVVVPCLLALQEEGYGVAKGIPTLVIAASSVDDVLAISAFTIILGVTFKPNADIIAVAFQGPIEAVVGLVFGIFWGLLATYLPGRDDPNMNTGRLIILLGGALLAMFGSSSKGVELPGSGALAVLVMAFVAGLGWRRQGWTDDNPVSGKLAMFWMILQPLLFGLIGTEIQINELEPSTLGMGVVVLIIGLILRVCASYAAVSFGDITLRERFFISLAWLPKATVQAAIGPLALDNAKALTSAREDKADLVSYGEKVLTIAVLAILITAPIGAIAIRLTAPKLLTKKSDETDEAPNQDVT